MKWLSIVLVFVVLYGCSDSDQLSSSMCDNPVQFANQKDATTNGYIVGILDRVNVNSEATRLIEKYTDLEIYSTIETCNCFYGNSGDKTIQALQCEENVDTLSYNNAIGIDKV